MATDQQIKDAVDNAKGLMKAQGRECTTTAAELKAWFEADTPFEDIGLDEVLNNTFIVIHELVEIEEVRKMGLRITKTTITDNLEKVDEAHLKAAAVELAIAFATGSREHILSRMPDIERWIEDPTVPLIQKRRYRRLLLTAKKMTEQAVQRAVTPVGGRPQRKSGR